MITEKIGKKVTYQFAAEENTGYKFVYNMHKQSYNIIKKMLNVPSSTLKCIFDAEEAMLRECFKKK